MIEFLISMLVVIALILLIFILYAIKCYVNKKPHKDTPGVWLHYECPDSWDFED